MPTPTPSETLIVVSDTICPWCFIGKRRLEGALTQLASEGLHFELEWRPFQLNPDMPDDGAERTAYRTAKFGSLAKSQAMDKQVADVGQEVGIGFRYDLITRTPNTLASHVMIADALRAGGPALQNRAAEALFQAYFVEGQDIGRTEVLRSIARDVGFDHGPSVNAALWELVEAQDVDARQAGIRGVPSVILGQQLLFSGAQPSDVMAQILRDAVAEAATG
jgi:predicted DsbA family dithiol-disulfide isomerase